MFLADMQTTVDIDTAYIRWKPKTNTSVRALIDEEQSADKEIAHVGEELGFLVLSVSANVVDRAVAD